jgi:hypothetical protein
MAPGGFEMPVVNTARAAALGDIILEAITQPVWDSAEIANGATLVSFFNNPGGKTLRQTNVRTSGQIAAPKQYVVKAVRFTVPEGTDIADQQAIYNLGVASLIIGDKPYLRLPLNLITAGCGLTGAYDSASAGTANQFVNGLPYHRNLYTLEWAIIIPPMQELRVDVEFPGGVTIAGDSFEAMFFLEGELGREVQ